jgi:hypothetical protein
MIHSKEDFLVRTLEDPSGFADGVNLYTYVKNNPTRYRDPLGLSTNLPGNVKIISNEFGERLHGNLYYLCNDCATVDRDYDLISKSILAREIEERAKGLTPGHQERITDEWFHLARCWNKKRECKQKKQKECPEIDPQKEAGKYGWDLEKEERRRLDPEKMPVIIPIPVPPVGRLLPILRRLILGY